MGKPIFEHETCSRCLGSGEFSYCQMYGRTCFKCGGSGWQLTARGKAAQKFFSDQKVAPVMEIKVGDWIECHDITSTYVVKVTSCGWSERCKWKDSDTGEMKPYYSISGINPKSQKTGGLHAFENSTVKRAYTKLERRQKIEEALAYQATLTKAGKPRKKAA